MRTRRPLGCVIGICTAVASGCGQDAVGPASRATVQVQLSTSDAAVGRQLVIDVGYIRPPAEYVSAAHVERVLESGRHSLPLAINIADCVKESRARGGSATCDLLVALTLRDATGRTLDSTQVGPLPSTNGETVTVPALELIRRIDQVVVTSPKSRVRVGNSMTLSAALLDRAGEPIDAQGVQWISSDPTVATISMSGLVTGLRAGTVAITAVSLADPTKRGTKTIPVPPPFAIRSWTGDRQFTIASGDVLADDIRGLWRTGPTDLWLATGTSGAMRYDGTTLFRLTPELSAAWNGVWGSGPTDVWFVGNGGVTAHFDGTRVTQATVGTDDLTAIWGTSPTNVFAVGARGRIIRWNGSAWSTQVSGTSASLLAVSGRSATDVFAAGQGGTIVHFDGTSWTPMTSGTQRDLRGMWGPPSADPIVVGDGGTVLRLSQNGSWRTENLGTDQQLRAVHGTSASDIWVVGSGDANGAAVFRFDGNTWLTVEGGAWLSVWAEAPGTSSLGSCCEGVLARSAGRFSVLVRGPTLFGATAVSPTLAYIAGATFLLARFDGVSWIEDGFVDPRGNAFFGTWTDTVTNTTLAVGDAPGRVRTTGPWSPAPTPNGTPRLWDVYGTSLANAFAVGERGVILRWNGAGWTAMTSPTTVNLYGVWGTGTGPFFAVGEQGTILRWQGSEWAPVASGTTIQLHGVWGSGPNDVFAVGGNGTIVHFDGTRWSPMTSGTTAWLLGVGGTREDEVYAVGSGGTVLRFDGDTWTPMSIAWSPSAFSARTSLYRVSVSSRGFGVIVGQGATVVTGK